VIEEGRPPEEGEGADLLDHTLHKGGAPGAPEVVAGADREVDRQGVAIIATTIETATGEDPTVTAIGLGGHPRPIMEEVMDRETTIGGLQQTFAEVRRLVDMDGTLVLLHLTMVAALTVAILTMALRQREFNGQVVGMKVLQVSRSW